jgi:hypothetical protein
MGSALTNQGTVKCDHSGSAALTGSGKLTVKGAKVLLEGDATWSIAGCQQTNSNNGEVPCLTVGSVTGGKSIKLTVGGSAVLLGSFTGASLEGKPTNGVSASAAGQSKLTTL